jgi:hypothetical protein
MPTHSGTPREKFEAQKNGALASQLERVRLVALTLSSTMEFLMAKHDPARDAELARKQAEAEAAQKVDRAQKEQKQKSKEGDVGVGTTSPRGRKFFKL